MKLFQRKKKKDDIISSVNPIKFPEGFNKRVIDAALYNIVIRYFGEIYEITGTTNSKRHSEPLIKHTNDDGSIEYKLNYSAFPYELFESVDEFIKYMRSTYVWMVDNMPEDNAEAVIEWYSTNTIGEMIGICRYIYRYCETRNVTLVNNLYTNNRISRLISEAYNRGYYIPSNVIFHDFDGFIKEYTNNVVDRSINDSSICKDIEFISFIYSGDKFDASRYSSPVTPSIDYILVRAYYSNHLIGNYVGYSNSYGLSENMFRNSKIKHIAEAHSYCTWVIENEQDMKEYHKKIYGSRF